MHTLTDKNGKTYHVSEAIFRKWIAEGTVQDGESVRVPIMLMDGKPYEAPLRRDMRMVDAWGNPAGSRPGWCFAVDGNDQREAAYQAYKRELRDAWRKPQRQPHAVEPVAPQQQHDQRQMTSDEAYALMCQELRDGWRQRR
jgi:hypothetical protein